MKREKARGRLPAGKLLMALGLVLLLCAGGLLAYNQWDDRRAGEESEAAAIALVEEIQSGEVEIQKVVEEAPEGPSAELLQVAELDGSRYMGVLTIPKLERILPVQSDWSLPKLKKSPCRYSGSLTGGELVICAHNYRKHFGGLATLSLGDSVVFTDLEGNQTFYEVREIYTVAATDIDGMVNSGYDLSLFTCNYGGKARITVRCSRTEAPADTGAAE